MRIVKISELRSDLQDIIDSVYYTGKPVIVARRNKPRVVINPLPKDDADVETAIKEYANTAKEILS